MEGHDRASDHEDGVSLSLVMLQDSLFSVRVLH
jgi:hypothetical protein